jgi:putative ABC transport system permease protein
VKRGDRVSLPAADGEQSFEIEDVFYDYSNDRGLLVMDRRTYIRHFKDDSVSNAAIYLKPSIDPETARIAIVRTLPGTQLRIASNRELREQVLRVFDRTFQVTYALEAIAVIVAVLGIANLLAALILERRPEIAMLRFIGVSQPQVRRTILLESGMVGVIGLGLGFLLGMILSWLLIAVINKQSFGWTIQFALPAAFLGQALALVFAATLMAGLYPAVLASRTDPIKSVRGE